MIESFIWSLVATATQAPALTPGYVFVTQQTGSGNLSTWTEAAGQGGLAAADTICSTEAAAAQLLNPQFYIGFVSDSNNDLYCRLHGLGGTVANNCGMASLPAFAGPWLRRDNLPFATLATLMNPGRAIMPPRLTATGASSAALQAYTGTLPGLVAQGTCGDWTMTSGTSLVAFVDSIDFLNGSDGCANARTLICIAAGQHTPINFARRSGRTAFIAQERGTGNLSTWTNAASASGLAAGDQVCQNEAATGNLPNAASFKAWLSGSSVNAIDRFQNDGPWVRVDGLPVTASKTELTSALTIQSVPIVIGSVLLPGDSVWTGTMASGTVSNGQHCQNWTSASASDTGSIGYSSYNSFWTQFSSRSCDDNTNGIYCFSDLDRVFGSGMESVPY
jgi:hypothetical protein